MSDGKPSQPRPSRWQAPAEPPPVAFDARAELAARSLTGDGLEIGALHQPLRLPHGARARYVDRMTVADLREQYPELAEVELVEADVIDDGETLSTIPDGSQDFIVANHFLEHTGDPISTIERHLRKLVPGGALFYAVPDKRYTFDVARPVTSIEHMLRDRSEGPGTSRRQHYEEWARYVYGSPQDPPRSEEAIAALARELDERDYSIHTHVWTQAEFLALLLRCRELFDEQFDIEAVRKAGFELLVVLRKAGAPVQPGDGTLGEGVTDAGAYIAELRLALDERDEQLAEAGAQAAAQRARALELLASPSWRASRPLRAGERLLAEVRRRRARSQRRAEVPLAALAADLAQGWPEGAEWLPRTALPGGAAAALRQAAGTTIAIPLLLPAGARLCGSAALPLADWNDDGGDAAFRVAVRGADGRELARAEVIVPTAMGNRRWRRADFELALGGDGPRDAALLLEVASVGETFGRRPISGGLWTDVAFELDEIADEAAPAAPGAAAHATAWAAARDRDATRAAPAHRPGEPLISILTPVHDPRLDFLEQLIEQVRRQTFEDWQLCLVDDGSHDPAVRELLERQAAEEPRIVLRRHEQARGISKATNAALALATGTFVALLDHDDALSGDALRTVADAIARDPDADMLYSDEDHLLASGRRYAPYRKPDWSPELMRSLMFTGHLGVYRRELVAALGGFRPELDGSQDYDLVLRVTERTDRIVHLPQLLYHWRVHERSAAADATAKPYAYEAARRALDEHLARVGIAGHVEQTDQPGQYRVVHELSPDTSVALLVALDRELTAVAGWQERLAACARAWGGSRALPQAVVAGPAGDVALARTALAQSGMPLVAAEVDATDRAALLNAAAAATDARMLLWLDPLARPDDGDDGAWIGRLAGHVAQPGVGAAGAKVLAPDGRVEHGGVVVPAGRVLPAHHGAAAEAPGHLANLRVAGNWSAVSGVVMTERATFERLGGLDAACGALAEVDYCLRLRAAGDRVVLVPDASLRRDPAAPARRNDLAAWARMRRRWRDALTADPYYNGAFWQERGDFTLADGG